LTNVPASTASNVSCAACIDSTKVDSSIALSSQLTPVATATSNLTSAIHVDQNAISPSVTIGFSGNGIVAGVRGGVIGGGGTPPGTSGGPDGSTIDINRVSDDFGTVGGGGDNQAGNAPVLYHGFPSTTDASFATVGGGLHNKGAGSSSTVGGGLQNVAGDYGFVGGGDHNTAAGSLVGGIWNTTVSGGAGNTAQGVYSTVSGGQGNLADGGPFSVGGYATVGGGKANAANGGYSTVPGGLSNMAGGNYSFAAGRRAKANHDGAFVWADSTDADFASTAADQFLIRASGGVGIGTANPVEALHVGSGNIYVSTPADGIILKSPDGTKCALIGLDNSGHLGTTAMACP
jgi:hypothetical protein